MEWYVSFACTFDIKTSLIEISTEVYKQMTTCTVLLYLPMIYIIAYAYDINNLPTYIFSIGLSIEKIKIGRLFY